LIVNPKRILICILALFNFAFVNASTVIFGSGQRDYVQNIIQNNNLILVDIDPEASPHVVANISELFNFEKKEEILQHTNVNGITNVIIEHVPIEGIPGVSGRLSMQNIICNARNISPRNLPLIISMNFLSVVEINQGNLTQNNYDFTELVNHDGIPWGYFYDQDGRINYVKVMPLERPGLVRKISFDSDDDNFNALEYLVRHYYQNINVVDNLENFNMEILRYDSTNADIQPLWYNQTPPNSNTLIKFTTTGLGNIQQGTIQRQNSCDCGFSCSIF